MSQLLSRRRFMLATAATTVTLSHPPAAAKVFRARQFHNQPKTSSLHHALVRLWASVKAETGGRFVVKTFAENDHISGSDPAALEMLVSGELEFFTLWGAILGAVVPVTEIQALPYIFKDRRQVFDVIDGELEAYLRKEMATKGIYGLPNGCFENGFRQISTRTKPIHNANDIVDMPIRIPDSQVFTDFFQSIGAKPQIINFGQLYDSLKQGIIEGQDNPLNVTETNRFYEVQRYMSITNHMWSGFNLIANLKSWNLIPSDIQEIIQRNVIKYVTSQRRDVNILNTRLLSKLTDRGMIFTSANANSFQNQMDSFYTRWKKYFGNTAWNLLEAQVGKIV
jgi:tripartite ATP-independent transporter DctP family solute receptor